MDYYSNVAVGSLVVLGGLLVGAVWLATFAVRSGRFKRIETALLAQAAIKTDNAVLVTSSAGLIEWVNSGFTQLSGFTLEEVKGKEPDVALLGPTHGSQANQRIKEGITAGANFSIEILCTHRNGQRYWLALAFMPIFRRRGNLTHFIVIGTDISSFKRSQEELGRANRRNELLLSAAGDGIYGVDLRGRISFVNPAAASITGWTAGELVGKPATVTLYQLRITDLPGGPDDLFMASAYQDNTVLIGDSDLFRRKDGTSFPVEYTSKPVFENGDLVGTVVVFRDISERAQVEALRVQQTHLAALRAEVALALAGNDNLATILQRCSQAIVKHLEGAFARIWTVNAAEDELELLASAGIYTHIDGHHSRIPVGTFKIGKIAKERVPMFTNDLYTDPNVSDREWIKREGMVGFIGIPLMVEGKLVGVAAMFSQKRLPDEALEMLGSIGDSIAQGIMRKRAEQKIHEQAALLEKAQDAIIVLDLSERCIFWNRSAERLYGWNVSDALGGKLNELIYRDTSTYEQARSEVLFKGEWRGECRQVTRSGQFVTVESQWTMVHDDAGQPKSILIVNTNISEKKTIQAQFLRTQRMESIGTLAGGIAHDLNNVLAPIMMSVEILKQKVKDDQSLRMLSIVESSAKRGADMVRQVLTFARGIEGERILLQTRHLVKEVAKIINETFPKSIQLRTQLPENLWPVMGDATQLHQVMVNLAVNARDAMLNGGTLSVSAENTVVEPHKAPTDGMVGSEAVQPGCYVVIKVSDTGSGIPPEILDKVFEPFFTTKEPGKGTGLGLATVLSIVKNHGGFLRVLTEVGKGTTLSIYLPALENAPTQAGENEPRNLPLGCGELILAVDDEAAVLTMTKETLENFGYRVVTAHDGTEAIAAYTMHRHEIKGVITDMLMPYMDGPTTIRTLRKLDPGIRVIAASGLMDSEKVRDSTGIENIAFLMKPYTADKLLNTIHKVLAEKN